MKVLKAVAISLAVLFVVPLFVSYTTYGRAQDRAGIIDNEILKNQKALETSSDPVFSSKEYDSLQKPIFYISNVDTHIDAFYINLPNFKSNLKNRNDLYDLSKTARTTLETYFYIPPEYTGHQINIISRDIEPRPMNWGKYWKYIEARGGIWNEMADSVISLIRGLVRLG